MGCRRGPGPYLLVCAAAFLLSACKTTKGVYSPAGKHHPERLREDFQVLRGALTDLHPSPYAYTSKRDLESLFDRCLASLGDSMTEPQFANQVVARAVSAIRCGHTSVSLSKGYTRAMRGVRLPSFPLYVKTWGDTMVVTRNLNRGDSSIRQGDILTSVDGMGPAEIRERVAIHLSTDGFNETLNEIRLSTSFPYYHRNTFGLSKEYRVGFVDSSGKSGMVDIACHFPEKDTVFRKDSDKDSSASRKRPASTKVTKRGYGLLFEEDGKSAVMEIRGFQHSLAMKGFYRRSFRDIRERSIGHLVIDIRNNGGGNVDNQARLARYLKSEPFRVADTAAAVSESLGKWRRYLSHPLFNGFLLRFFTVRKEDGLHHLRYWERHLNRPKKKYFFKGEVYLLIGGPTFSAASLFAGTLKGQTNVTIVGEETGGGAYSNNGLLIPTLTLPNTGIRVRLPLFRLVPDRDAPSDGKGVIPDIWVRPTVEAVRKGTDRKMEAVRSLIRERIGK